MNAFSRLKDFWNDATSKLIASTAAETATTDAPAKEATKKYRRTGFKLQAGYAWNPLLSYPRSKGCFCGSGDKAKKCCMPYINRACSQAEADIISDVWPKLMTGRRVMPRAPQSQARIDAKAKANAPAPAEEVAAA